jgi:tetratricopeptide (TPR) repeat protein
MKAKAPASMGLLSVALTLAGVASAQTGKKAQAPPAAAPHELALQGKTTAAVGAALKSPDGVAAALKALYDKADTQVTDRQIADAKATLSAAGKFLDETARRSPQAAPPREPLEGRNLRLEGIDLSDQKQYGKAEPVLRRALELSQKSKDVALQAGIHNNLGHALRHQTPPKEREAVKEFVAARDLAEGAKDMPRAASYNYNLGLALHQSRSYEQAFDAFKRAVEQSRTAGKTNVEALALLWQGRSLSMVNSVSPEPLKYLTAAQKLFEKLGDSDNLGWCYFSMGSHTAYSLKYREAATFGESAIEPFTKAGDREGLRLTYKFLVEMYGRLNEPAKAEASRKKELEFTPPAGAVR